MSENTNAPAPDGVDDGGAFGRFMARAFGRSWRTTCGGLTAGVLGLIAIAPVPPAIREFAREAGPIVAGVALVFAKDGKVSGLPR